MGPLLVRFSAGRLARPRGAVPLLAASRTIADPYSLGRVAGVLGVCGIALGVELEQSISLLFEDDISDRGFYPTGFALAGAATAFAVLTGAFTMVVGALLGLPAIRANAPMMLLIVVLTAILTPVVCAVVAGMSSLVARLMAGSIRAAADPENLRTA